jgi:IS30 family transposase
MKQPWPHIAERIQQRQQRVHELTHLGMTSIEIAAILNTTQRTVVRDRRATGCAQQPAQPLTPSEIRQAQQLLDDGCSILEVSRTIRRAPITIRRHFPGRAWTREQISEHQSTIRRYTFDPHPSPRRSLVS